MFSSRDPHTPVSSLVVLMVAAVFVLSLAALFVIPGGAQR